MLMEDLPQTILHSPLPSTLSLPKRVIFQYSDRQHLTIPQGWAFLLKQGMVPDSCTRRKFHNRLFAMVQYFAFIEK